MTKPLFRIIINVVITLLTIPSTNAQTQSTSKQFNKEILSYIDYLERENTSAKDYIISLFKTKDIIILCERDHRELTQYDLILDVIKDPYFIENVGVVYTEVGDQNLNPDLNIFLSTHKLEKSVVDKNILQFQRNAMSPLWSKTSFSYFLNGLYHINKDLSIKKKVQMFPLDFLGALDNPTPENLKRQFTNQIIRDSLMADAFITNHQNLKENHKKKKALIIMNSRHAFKKNIVSKGNQLIKNAGHFISVNYPEIVASVMINNWSQDEGANFFSLVQDGKWDAAFQYLKIEDIGFNIQQSPFGLDRLDYGKWMLANNSLTYQDVFDGFVFYKPIGKFKMGEGVDGLMDDGFYKVYIERAKMFNDLFKKDVFPIDNETDILKYNQVVISPMNNLEELQKKIEKWLDIL